MPTTTKTLGAESTVIHQASRATRVYRFSPDGVKSLFHQFVGTGSFLLPMGEYEFVTAPLCSNETDGSIEIITPDTSIEVEEEPCVPGPPVGLVNDLAPLYQE